MWELQTVFTVKFPVYHHFQQQLFAWPDCESVCVYVWLQAPAVTPWSSED